MQMAKLNGENHDFMFRKVLQVKFWKYLLILSVQYYMYLYDIYSTFVACSDFYRNNCTY